MDERYRSKPVDYFDAIRGDIITCLKGKDLAVLDVGCGTGATGAALLNRGIAAEVRGIELVPDCAAIARQNLTEVVCGDVEDVALPWLAEHFHYILAGDC